jgi:hypothetical protein
MLWLSWERDILVNIVPIVRILSSTMFIIVMRSLGVTQMTLVPLKWLFHKGRAQRPFGYLSPWSLTLSDPMDVGYQNMPKRTLQVLGVALEAWFTWEDINFYSSISKEKFCDSSIEKDQVT